MKYIISIFMSAAGIYLMGFNKKIAVKFFDHHMSPSSNYSENSKNIIRGSKGFVIGFYRFCAILAGIFLLIGAFAVAFGPINTYK